MPTSIFFTSIKKKFLAKRYTKRNFLDTIWGKKSNTGSVWHSPLLPFVLSETVYSR